MAKNLSPTISVVLCVYNGAEYIEDAVDSILNQTFSDFELIIINDGSDDNTLRILKSYADSRIRLFNQKNKGLVESLNRGISLAKGMYIARQDADDISKPDRLEKIYSVVEADPNLVIVGSSMYVMNENGDLMHEHKVLLNDPELKLELMVRSPFAHGSVIFKKNAFTKIGGYKKDEWPAEDYGLWLRLSTAGSFANLDESLYIYRDSSKGISSNNRLAQESKKALIQKKAWKQRKQLIPKRIDTSKYKNLVMGETRLERLLQNLLFVLHRTLAKLDAKNASKIIVILLYDYGLRRKCGRLFFAKIRIKHAK